MSQVDDLTTERAAQFLEGWEIMSPKMAKGIAELMNTARQEALRDVLSDLDSLHWKDHWYADQLRRKINERLL